MTGKWFDELRVGHTFDRPIRRTLTGTDDILFSAMTHNPAQLHLDEEYCRLADDANAGLARLAGLTWGAEDLSTEIGASTNLEEAGGWAFTYPLVRSLTLMAAFGGSTSDRDPVWGRSRRAGARRLLPRRARKGLRAALRSTQRRWRRSTGVRVLLRGLRCRARQRHGEADGRMLDIPPLPPCGPGTC